ncbi:ArnT family glycosyltransferase [Dyella psychrodurans]|uniref:Glycosyltransferase family 39 protein n=1 Tax=Dyella psychrodurans TaxID=1927960 RepID=A0A370X7G5_9GAMM|nr:glycosyltransferase family 39 protein [Dyella psychrodurans]RDS84379.1 glycosyltransferase family 39 protein [Dyella psychrodurans]
MPTSANATPQERRLFWLLAAFALLMLGIGIGLRDPWPSDEPRFTLAAKQMVESGDWLFPHRGVELYADKPPMLMWLEAASFEIVRSWRIAFMLPSLLSALGTLWLVYDLGRRLWTRKVGMYAAMGVLMCVQFIFQAKRAQIDPLVVFFITAANWGLLRHTLCGPNWRAYWFGCFCAGLGVITKGVGFLALFMLLPYVWASLRKWNGVATMGSNAWWRWLLGLAATLAAIGVWLVPMLLAAHAHADDPRYTAYVNNILFHQTAGRYAHAWHHIHSAFYYLPIMLYNWLPLSLTYPGTLPRWWRALKAKDARILVPLGWIVLVLLFFSASAGKRDVYILPILPMLALITAPYLDELLATRWLRALCALFAALIGTGMLALGVYALIAHPAFATKLAFDRGFEGPENSLWWMCIVIGAAQWILLAIFRLRRAHWAVAGGMLALWMMWGTWAYALLNDSSSSVGLMNAVRTHLGPQDEIGLVDWKEQNKLMLDHPSTDFGFTAPTTLQFTRAAAWQAAAPATRWLFAQDPAMGDCVQRDKAINIGHANRRNWWLFKADAVVPGCVPSEHSDADDPGE